MSAVYELFESIPPAIGLWESHAKHAVLQSLRSAQQGADDERRKDFQKLHDFYQGAHRSHLEESLKKTHPRIAPTWNKEAAWHRYYPLVRMRADLLSVCFHRPPETYLIKDGARLPEDDPQVIQWRKDEEAIELDTTLPAVEALINQGQNQAFVQPSWVRGRPRWQVHAPYEVWIRQSADEPSELDSAEVVSVILPQRSDTPYANNDNLYLSWERRDIRDAFGRISNTEWFCWLHNDAGTLQANPLFPDYVNRYSMTPLVCWRTEKPASGCFWLEPAHGWIREQLAMNTRLMDLDHLLTYQSHSQGIMKLSNTLQGSPEMGPGVLLKSEDPDFSLEYVSPDPNVPEYIEALNFIMRAAAVGEHLPPSTFEATANRNLAAKKLEQHALRMRRERVLPFYRRALRRTFDAHRSVVNYWRQSGGVTYDDDIELGVNFAPIPEVVDRFQDTQALSAEVNLGLTSSVDAYMRREGVTRTQAERAIGQFTADTHGEPDEDGVGGPVFNPNGAQIAAAVDIASKVALGELPRDAGVGLIRVMFNLSEDQAKAMLGEAGAGFTPTAPGMPPGTAPAAAVAGDGVPRPPDVERS